MCWQAALKTAFETLDSDGSGTIDGKELYAGVLLLYLKLKGLVKVNPPSREMVLQLMEASDIDRSGELDYAEFEAIMKPLSLELLARAVLQLVVTLTCPFLASVLFCWGRRWREKHGDKVVERARRCLEALECRVVGRVALRFLGLLKPLGLFLWRNYKRLPSTFPVVMLATLLMKIVSLVLLLVDHSILHLSSRVAAHSMPRWFWQSPW